MHPHSKLCLVSVSSCLLLFWPSAQAANTAVTTSDTMVLDNRPLPPPPTISDELSRRLRAHQGRVDLFSWKGARKGGLAPEISGGVDHEGAMLRLRWPADSK